MECSSEKKVSQLLSVQLTIGFFFSVSLFFAYFIIKDSGGISIDLSADGLNYAVQLFKVPLATLAIIPVLVSLLAANHRSHQTAKSIQLSYEAIRINSEQNTFANYYKHKEEFLTSIRNLEDDLRIRFFRTSELYRNIFPMNSVMHVSVHSTSMIPEDSYSFLQDCIASCIDLVGRSQEINPTEEYVATFYQDLHCLTYKLHFYPQGSSPMYPDRSGDKMHLLYSVSDPLSHLKLVETVLMSLKDFGHYSPHMRFNDFDLSEGFKSKSAVIFGYKVY